MIEYKVLTEKDSTFGGSFDAESLEVALNSYAAQGWRVFGSFLATSLWKSTKSEIMIILERGTATPGPT